MRDLFPNFILKNNIFNASGTLGYGLEFSKQMDLNILGALVLKSTTIYERKGNLQPTIYFGSNFVINSVGLKNPGIEKVTTKILPKLLKNYPDLPIIASVWGKSISEYLYLIRKMNNFANIISYEINISCPNIENSIDFQSDLIKFEKLITEIMYITNKNIIIKLSPTENILKITNFINKKTKIEIVTVANTYKMKYLLNNKPVVGNVIGGMSGKKIKNKTLELVKQISNSTNLKIIACGGIFSKQDIIDYQIAGATAFQIGSANLIDLNIIQVLAKENYN